MNMNRTWDLKLDNTNTVLLELEHIDTRPNLLSPSEKGTSWEQHDSGHEDLELDTQKATLVVK